MRRAGCGGGLCENGWMRWLGLGWVLGLLLATSLRAEKTVEVPVDREAQRSTLPGGVTLLVRRSQDLVAQRDGKQVVVFREPRHVGPCPDGLAPVKGGCGIYLSHVQQTADGGVTVDLEGGGSVHFRRGELDARLELSTIAAQPPAQALQTLARVLQLDPKSWEAASELATRHLQAGHPDEAASVVAALVLADPVLGYDRLASAGRLRSLLDRPALSGLRSPTPGLSRLGQLPTQGAFSARANAVAIEIEERINTSGHRGYDTQQGLILFQRVDDPVPDLTLPKSARPRVERLLRDLGFQADPGAEEATDAQDIGPNEDVKQLERAGLTLRLSLATVDDAGRVKPATDDRIRLYQGDKLLSRGLCTLSNLHRAVYYPAARIVVAVARDSGSAGIDRVCALRVPR